MDLDEYVDTWKRINNDDICPSCQLKMEDHNGYYKCNCCGFIKLIINPYDLLGGPR
ncbi:MAG: hypothetical protein K8E24_012170 [Methanobacterium paludis]|nr:hypothetical protein [Methanobacterium paludis]